MVVLGGNGPLPHSESTDGVAPPPQPGHLRQPSAAAPPSPSPPPDDAPPRPFTPPEAQPLERGGGLGLGALLGAGLLAPLPGFTAAPHDREGASAALRHESPHQGLLAHAALRHDGQGSPHHPHHRHHSPAAAMHPHAHPQPTSRLAHISRPAAPQALDGAPLPLPPPRAAAAAPQFGPGLRALSATQRTPPHLQQGAAAAVAGVPPAARAAQRSRSGGRRAALARARSTPLPAHMWFLDDALVRRSTLNAAALPSAPDVHLASRTPLQATHSVICRPAHHFHPAGGGGRRRRAGPSHRRQRGAPPRELGRLHRLHHP